MIEVISNRTPRARKEYMCDASHICNNYGSWSEMGLTFWEYRQVAIARANNYRIKKGEKYVYQFNKDGDTYVFRAIPAIHDICIKYKVYEGMN